MSYKSALLTIIICTQTHPVSADSIKFIETPTIYIARTADLKVNSDAQLTFESFVRNWSQFEILIDKKLFPIAAPNCKEIIRIRFKGIEPLKNQSNQIQRTRWELLKRIRDENGQNTLPLFLQIDTKQYMRKSGDGKYVLDYCNVFAE